MAKPNDSDPPKSPGLYGKYTPIEHDRGDEPSQVTLAILARMASHDSEYMRKKLLAARNSSVPPPKKKEHSLVTIIVAPIVVAAILAVGAAAFAMYRNDVISEERQATTDRRISAIDVDLRQHAAGTHPMSIESTARLDAQFNAVLVRLDRIERQLDAQPRRPR